MSNFEESGSHFQSEFNVNGYLYEQQSPKEEATAPQLKVTSSEALARGIEALADALRLCMSESVTFKKPQDDFEAMFYDNVSMCEHLHCSVRTLQRHRKAGKIRFTIINGKVYYPKNFLIDPGETTNPPTTPTAYCRPDPHQKVVPHASTRPRSKLIDLHRLKRSICRCRWDHRRYDSAEVIQIRKLHQAARWEKGKDLQLWPKKIRFVSLPFKKSKKS